VLIARQLRKRSAISLFTVERKLSIEPSRAGRNNRRAGSCCR
jgi:hypothetical protein